MLAKCLPDDSLYVISAYCSGQYFFPDYNSKSGIFFTIAHKKNFEVTILHLFGTNNMAKTVFAQQSMLSRKLGRQARLQVRLIKPRVYHLKP